MGLHKGQTNNKEGRPIGAVNKVTKELRQRINDFLSENWEQVAIDFSELQPKERLHFYEKLMQYSIPKLQNVFYQTDVENKLEALTDSQLNELYEKIKQGNHESQ